MALFDFGKKKNESKREEVYDVLSNIKILGGGCKSCHTLYENVEQAVKNAGLTVEVEYITDMEQVMLYGIMSMPGLVINEKVVSVGKVLKTEDVEKLLENYPKKPDVPCENKPKVAFVCVHNSCRSQIAEALGKKLASDVFESYSAGTEQKDHINSDAVRIMKKLHGIDMEQDQYNKQITDIPEPDIAIFMGCNVSCPNMKSQYVENWGLEDPSGQSDEVFIETIQKIEENIIDLREKLKQNLIKLS